MEKLYKRELYLNKIRGFYNDPETIKVIMKNSKTRIPFYNIKDMYPRYLFLLDFIIKNNIDGIKNVNIAKFIGNNQDL